MSGSRSSPAYHTNPARRMPHDRCVRTAMDATRPDRAGRGAGRVLRPPTRPPRSDRPDRRLTARMDGVGRPAVLHRLQGARRARVVHRDRSSGPRSRTPNARRRSSSTTSPTITWRLRASSVSSEPSSSGTRWAARSRSRSPIGIVRSSRGSSCRRPRWSGCPAGVNGGVGVSCRSSVRCCDRVGIRRSCAAGCHASSSLVMTSSRTSPGSKRRSTAATRT